MGKTIDLSDLVVLTLCISFLSCDISTENPSFEDELEKNQRHYNSSDVSTDNWTKEVDWKSDKVWQNMLAVAVQVLCVPCSSQMRYRRLLTYLVKSLEHSDFRTTWTQSTETGPFMAKKLIHWRSGRYSEKV